MSLESNKAKAVAFMQDFAATAKIDLSLFTDDATWWTFGSGDVPISDHAQRVSALSSLNFAGPGRFEIERVTAEGECVAIEAKGFQPLRQGGSYDNVYVWVVRFDGKRICQVKAYFDTALAQRTFASS